MPVTETHVVSGHSLERGWPEGFQQAIFGLGCFWGAERRFWQQEGVWVTAVGYAGGITPNPTYEEVCSGKTGHTEVVKVVFDPAVTRYEKLLQVFWESHDPTQGMQQGNDRGTQYRSAIYTFDEDQQAQARASAGHYQQQLDTAGMKKTITTEIAAAPEFYFAETYHQQYLARTHGWLLRVGWYWCLLSRLATRQIPGYTGDTQLHSFVCGSHA